MCRGDVRVYDSILPPKLPYLNLTWTSRCQQHPGKKKWHNLVSLSDLQGSPRRKYSSDSSSLLFLIALSLFLFDHFALLRATIHGNSFR